MKRVQLLILFILFLVALSIHWLLSIKELFADIAPTMIVEVVTETGDLYYADTTISTAPNWTKNADQLTSISLSNKQVVVVNTAGDIFYKPEYKLPDSAWKMISIPNIKASQVSFDGYNMVLLALTPTGDLYYADTTIPTAPNWTKNADQLQNVSLSNKQVVVVNTAGDIFYKPDYKLPDSAWKMISIPSIKASQVSFDGYKMVLLALTTTGDLYYADTTIPTTPNWTKNADQLKNITLSNNQVVGINTAGDVFYKPDYKLPDSAWKMISVPSVKASQVSFDGGVATAAPATPATAPTATAPTATAPTATTPSTTTPTATTPTATTPSTTTPSTTTTTTPKPLSYTYGSADVDTTTDITTDDTTTDVTADSLPSGMKFSEVIDNVLKTYGQNDLVSKDKLQNVASVNSKSSYYDDIYSKLNTIPLGPKDYYNANITDRCTDVISPTVPKTNSDALQQGSWFRSERQNSPYASSQCGQTPLMYADSPSPASLIDNNDYIRKDSIPCWGCKLK